jgi:hypothetical protein
VTFLCRGINATRNDLDTFDASYTDLSSIHQALLRDSGREEAKRLYSCVNRNVVRI